MSTSPHPIVEELFRVLGRAHVLLEDGTTTMIEYVLDQEDDDRLARQLAELSDGERPWALRSVYAVAWQVEQGGWQEQAETIRRLCRQCPEQGTIRTEMASSASGLLSARRRRAQVLLGGPERPVASKPTGGVRPWQVRCR